MNKKILVADDEQNIRLLMRRMLSNRYDVIEAQDGQEAIDIAHSENPDLILMDLLMPGVDGYSALSSIKEDKSTAKIPVIIVSAVGLVLNKELADRLGAAGYVTKPIDMNELLGVIGKYLPGR